MRHELPLYRSCYATSVYTIAKLSQDSFYNLHDKQYLPVRAPVDIG